MSDFQCKFYLLDGAETLECKEGNAEYVIKLADRPFPDSLLAFVYYDINSWEPRFHEADRALMEFYQSRDAKCLKPVQKLLDDFKDEHPYFFYLWLDWSNRLKQATPDFKNPTKLLPHKELAHVPSNLATMQQQILRLFQTVLDASITDVDFSVRVQAYEQAPSLQKFDFQPMKISFEFVEEKQFAEVLYPQNMYDLIDWKSNFCKDGACSYACTRMEKSTSVMLASRTVWNRRKICCCMVARLLGTCANSLCGKSFVGFLQSGVACFNLLLQSSHR